MPKKQKNKFVQFLHSALTLLLVTIGGAIFGLFIGKQIAIFSPKYSLFVQIGIMLGFFLLSYYLHIILHEGGHLIFGLMTGYQFSSFRIGGIVFTKKNGIIERGSYHLAGTGGQCLLSPPEMKNGSFPVVLYNLGGCITNLAFSLLILPLAFLLKENIFFGFFAPVFCFCGILIAAMNGIPIQSHLVNNDGYNALSLRNNDAALRGFWIQLKVNALTAQDVPLSKMPDEWFTLPSAEQMQNCMVAPVAVLACNRLMYEEKFEKADALMESIIESENAVIELHRGLLICDRIVCNLLSGNTALASELLDKDQVRLMTQLKGLPSVARTQFFIALLLEKDRQKAQKNFAQFESLAKGYPYQAEIESERHLIALAKLTAQTEN